MVLLVVGQNVILKKAPRLFAPALATYLLSEWFLSEFYEGFAGYPTRFINGFASLYFLALVAPSDRIHSNDHC